MTDWGDACLNEKARSRTWAQPPSAPESLRSRVAAMTQEERLAAGLGYAPAPTPDPATWRHDKGDRDIPSEEGR